MPAHLAVEGNEADSVTELVRDGRHRRDGVERDVQPRRPLERRPHQPPDIDDADDVPVLLDAVLVRHRPAYPRARRPVDPPDVVVGLVVPNRVELGPEAELAAGPPPLLAEAPAANRRREPACGRK